MCYIRKRKTKEKQILQNSHHISAHNKQNQQPIPVINYVLENDNPFWQKKSVPGKSKYSGAL